VRYSQPAQTIRYRLVGTITTFLPSVKVRTTTGRRALAVAHHAGHWDDADRLVDQAYAAFGSIQVLGKFRQSTERTLYSRRVSWAPGGMRPKGAAQHKLNVLESQEICQVRGTRGELVHLHRPDDSVQVLANVLRDAFPGQIAARQDGTRYVATVRTHDRSFGCFTTAP
jgi:hypothetical protein